MNHRRCILCKTNNYERDGPHLDVKSKSNYLDQLSECGGAAPRLLTPLLNNTRRGRTQMRIMV